MAQSIEPLILGFGSGHDLGCRIAQCGALIQIVFFFFNCYLFIHESHRDRGRDRGRGRNRHPAGSLMWAWIPGPWDHDLS